MRCFGCSLFLVILIRRGIYLKVVHPVCCVVDIWKTFSVGTVISTANGVQPLYQNKTLFYIQFLLPHKVWAGFKTYGKETSNARMILTAIFLNEYGDWNLIDLFKMDMPDSFKEWQLSEAVKQATKFLENLQLLSKHRILLLWHISLLR